MPDHDNLDAIIVGAGLAGLYQLFRFRERGLRALVIEAADGVGGTWFWNRYPTFFSRPGCSARTTTRTPAAGACAPMAART
jgi:cation diffusion facilitator CzcD-associated flavoprotein CzcO